MTDRPTFLALRRAPSGRAGAVRVRVLEAHPPSPDDSSGRQSDTGDTCQVAFALPKRVGGAVVRNRIRRRLRAVMVALDEVEPSGADRATALRPRSAYLLSAEVEAASCPFPLLRSWVIEAVRRAHDQRVGAGA